MRWEVCAGGALCREVLIHPQFVTDGRVIVGREMIELVEAGEAYAIGLCDGVHALALFHHVWHIFETPVSFLLFFAQIEYLTIT